MATDTKQKALAILKYLEESEWSAYQKYRAERQRQRAMKLEAQQPDIREFHSRCSKNGNYPQNNQSPYLTH
jgi:hypothetical protein